MKSNNLPESTILEGSHDIFAAVLSADTNETRIRLLFVDICLVESHYIWVVTGSGDLKIYIHQLRAVKITFISLKLTFALPVLIL